jgi:hypothetical protein
LHSHGPLSVRLCTGLECVNAVAGLAGNLNSI